MEDGVKNFINAVIGIVKTLQDEVEHQYNDLRAAGEAANDELSKQIKNSVDNALKVTHEYQDKLHLMVNDFQKQVQEVIDKLNPTQVTEEIKGKIGELSKLAADLVDKLKQSGKQQ